MTLAPDKQILIRCCNLGEHDLKIFEHGEKSVHSDQSGSGNFSLQNYFGVEEAYNCCAQHELLPYNMFDIKHLTLGDFKTQ
jgi:hypothetical protein